MKIRFFKKSNEEKLSLGFESNVRKAISLLENDLKVESDEDFINLLTSNGINRFEAIEILLFLPVAFVRKWLHTAKWLDNYFVYTATNKRQIERTFSDTEAYQIILKVTEEYFQNEPKSDTIIKIGGRSAEFHAINKLMNDNPKLKVEEVEFTPTVFIR